MTRASEQPGTNVSIHRSFLVRLYPEIDPPVAQISGVIEHIVSGEAREFSSVAELASSISILLGRKSVPEE